MEIVEVRSIIFRLCSRRWRRLLENFRIAHYSVEITARDPLVLLEYKGSTLRGAFGHTFRRLCCAQRQDTCAGCQLRETCPYFYIFETAPGPGAEMLGNYENVPRPFVLEPPLTKKTQFAPGESLYFNLILIGRAINYLPYFIVTLRELGGIGIGAGKGRFDLTGIKARHPLNGKEETVYQEDGLVHNVNQAVTFPEVAVIPAPEGNILGITFTTMTRLNHRGHLVDWPEFPVIMHNLLWRIFSLAYFHCGEKLEIASRGLATTAELVRLIDYDTLWVDWERFSSRQQVKMKMGGIVGAARYRVPEEDGFAPFWPWLKIGELVHIGKNTVFGLGKIHIS